MALGSKAEGNFDSSTWKSEHPIAGVGEASRAYNPCMLQSLYTLFQASVMERLTLLANHVIAAEPLAQQRLQAHSGRSFSLRLNDWPTLLPAPPALAYAITPAGLLEWIGSQNDQRVPDLMLSLDASNPARSFAALLKGERPRVDIDGDAALAAELSWMMDNLRWDVTDDLARIVGPGPAHELARVFSTVAGGIRQAVASFQGVADKVGAQFASVVSAASGRRGSPVDSRHGGAADVNPGGAEPDSPRTEGGRSGR